MLRLALLSDSGKIFMLPHWMFVGTMLIHYAAEYGNPETLRAIMRHYPFYRRIILDFLLPLMVHLCI